MDRYPSWRHWVVVAILIPFGVVTGFSIGIPFLLLGWLLLMLSPVRRRPAVFWPPIVGLVAFVVGYLLRAPDCSSISINGGPTRTYCRVLFGFDFQRTGSQHHQPSLTPALFAGLGAAVLFGGIAWILISRSQSATASGEVQPNGR